MYALAPSVITVGAGWGRSQEWLLRARVLWDWLHNARPNSSAQGDGDMAVSQRPTLQDNGLRGHLEQPVRVGGYGRFTKD